MHHRGHPPNRVHYKCKLYFKIQTEINNILRGKGDTLKICIALIINMTYM